MFDYDKLAKKLGKFNDLSGKKQKKVLETIFCTDDFRDWFYGVGENSEAQPMTKPMVNKIFTSLATPAALKSITKFVKNKTSEDFDHSACSIAFLVVEQAIEISNKANAEIADSYKNGDLVAKEAKGYKEKSEKYGEYVADLMAALKDKARPEVKEICKKTNLPKGMVFTTYFMIPGRKYVPKFKVGMYVNQLLQEIYKWTGVNGIEDISAIRWGSYFGTFFGSEMTSSAAISILLEGVRRIDAYRDSEHFDNVREVWDSLTNFAMTELDKAPENVRKQMIEIYVKRIDRIFHNGNGPRLRVDMLNIPNNFANLADTVSKYTERISRITRANMQQVDNFRKEYQKPREEKRERDTEEKFNKVFEDRKPEKKIDRDDDDDIPEFNFVTDDDDDDE